MAILSFSGEVYCELTGYSLELDFDYEVYEDDISREDLEQMGRDFASFRDPEVLQYVLDNLSVTLNLENVEV